jgi:hypothetical protein
MMGTEGLTSLEARLLDNNLQHIQRELARQGTTLEAINISLQTLARVEERQAQISDRLKDGSIKITELDQRLGRVETTIPGLKEVRAWVIMGVLGGLGMMAVAVFQFIFVHKP